MNEETRSDRMSISLPGRLYGLDAARGIAVILMVEQHLGVWLWTGPSPGRSFVSYGYMIVLSGFGGLAAPLFLLLLGVGTIFFVEKSRAATGQNLQLHNQPNACLAPQSVQLAKNTLLLRGMGLLVLGYGLSLLTPSWFSLRSWFVLHLMGVCLLSSPWLSSWSIRKLIILAIAIVVMGAGLQWGLSTPTNLYNAYMAARLEEQDTSSWVGQMGWMLRLAFAEGQFPIFPWSAIFIFGLVAGKWLKAGRLYRLVQLAVSLGLITGIGALLNLCTTMEKTSFAGRLLSILVPFFPASPIIVLGLAGAALITVYSLLRWTQLLRFHAQHGLVCLGRASLTILFAHVWVLREGSQRLGWWQSFGEATVLLCIVALLVFAIFATKHWSRFNYRYGAEWLLRKIAPRQALANKAKHS